jgi:hypothetical protein
MRFVVSFISLFINIKQFNPQFRPLLLQILLGCVQQGLLINGLLKQFATALVKLKDFNESLIIIDVLDTSINDLLGVRHLAKLHRLPFKLVLFKFEIIEHLIWVTLA